MGHSPGNTDLYPDGSNGGAGNGSGRWRFQHKMGVLFLNVGLLWILLGTFITLERIKLPREMRITHLTLSNNGKSFDVIDADGVLSFLLEDDNYTRPNRSQPVVDYLPIDYSKPINCSLVSKFNRYETERAQFMMWHNPPKRIHAAQYRNLTADCARYVEERGYSMKPLSQEEALFPIAYSIRMHKNVEQAERLLRIIYMPQNVYCIHVDRRASKYIHEAMASIARCLPNVFLSSVQYLYIYGGFTPVLADMRCMKDLLHSPVRWKYYLNMAGTEFPLKTNLEIVRILKYLNGSNEIESFPFPPQYNYRLTTIYTSRKGEVVSTGIKKEPFHDRTLRMRKGCSYNTFSRQFVEWLLEDSAAQRFINWTMDSSSPDETVWATLNTFPRAPGGYTTSVLQTNRNFLSRAIVWSWSVGGSCRRKYFVHQICIFSTADFAFLSKRSEMFANKFDMTYDSIVLDCLEENLRSRMRNPDPDKYVNWDWISQLPHIKSLRKAGHILDQDHRT